jgi:hypothetical protein
MTIDDIELFDTTVMKTTNDGVENEHYMEEPFYVDDIEELEELEREIELSSMLPNHSFNLEYNTIDTDVEVLRNLFNEVIDYIDFGTVN